MSSSSSSPSPPLDIFIRIPLLPDAVHIEDPNNELHTVSDIQHRLLTLVAAAQEGEAGRHHTRRTWGSCRLIRGGKELRGPTLLSTLGLSRGEHLHGLLIEGVPASPSPPSLSSSAPHRTTTTSSSSRIPPPMGNGDGQTPLTSRERLIAIRRLQMDARLAASRREADGGGGNDEMIPGVSPLDAVAAFNRLWPQDDIQGGEGAVGGGVDEGNHEVDGRFGSGVLGSDVQRRRPGTMPPRPTPQPQATTTTPTTAANAAANTIDVQEIIQRALREPRWRLAAGCLVGFLLHVVAVPLIFFGFIVSTSTDVKGYTAQYWRGTNGSVTASNILRHHIKTVSERLSDQHLDSQKEAGDVSVVEMDATVQGNGDAIDAHPDNQQLAQSYEGDGSLFKQLHIDTSLSSQENDNEDNLGGALLRVPPTFFAPHRGSTYSTVLETNTDDYWMRSGHETGSMLFFCGLVMGAAVNVGFATFATFSADTLIVASPQ